MRRRAKTPILSIGQLEDLRPRNAHSRTSSVDLIAEQYRAVLESRRSSVYSNESEPELSTGPSDYDTPVTLRRQRRSVNLREETLVGDSPRSTYGVNPSPMSDDGTLVSFQDEAVYFKPISFSPDEPQSPVQPLSRRNTADDNLSLQICLDLLTRELTSAVAGRPSRSSTSTSALQIWVMIEAYEKLRDQMAELSRDNEQARAMEMMFDMWLRALYSVHESMVARERSGNADYGAALGTEDLD